MKEDFYDDESKKMAVLNKSLSHPARLSILRYVANSETCISGDISDFLPLSRTTVLQHLKELKKVGLLKGEIDGSKTKYCIDTCVLNKFLLMINEFTNSITPKNDRCC